MKCSFHDWIQRFLTCFLHHGPICSFKKWRKMWIQVCYNDAFYPGLDRSSNSPNLCRFRFCPLKAQSLWRAESALHFKSADTQAFLRPIRNQRPACFCVLLGKKAEAFRTLNGHTPAVPSRPTVPDWTVLSDGYRKRRKSVWRGAREIG